MFLKGYRFFGGAISFYRVLLFSAPSFTFISHRGSGSGSTSSSSNAGIIVVVVVVVGVVAVTTSMLRNIFC